MDYPILRRLEEQLELPGEHAYFSNQSAVYRYNPPPHVSMGPPSYPPASRPEASNASTFQGAPTFEGYDSRKAKFRGGYGNELWNFPSALQQARAIFVIPTNLGMFHEAFTRWESITRYHVAAQGFTDPREKIEYIENFLGEIEKLAWIQWRMAYNAEFENLVAQADGREGTQNILSHIRRVFSFEDPEAASAAIQDEAYRDLERLSCPNLKNIFQYMKDYSRLAPKTGRMFISGELSEKFWHKMPNDLGTRIKAAYDAKYPGNIAGVFPRILFAYKFLEAECKDAALKRSLKDLSFCSPGYYGREKGEKMYCHAPRMSSRYPS